MLRRIWNKLLGSPFIGVSSVLTCLSASCSEAIVCQISPPPAPGNIVSLVQMLEKRLRQLKTEHKERPLVVVGLSLGVKVAMAATARVAADLLVCIGLHIQGKSSLLEAGVSPRELVQLKIPTLFAVGQRSRACPVSLMEEVRFSETRRPTSLLAWRLQHCSYALLVPLCCVCAFVRVRVRLTLRCFGNSRWLMISLANITCYWTTQVRHKMIAKNKLVIVRDGDEILRIPMSKRIQVKLTQQMFNQLVLQELCAFILEIVNKGSGDSAQGTSIENQTAASSTEAASESAKPTKADADEKLAPVSNSCESRLWSWWMDL